MHSFKPAYWYNKPDRLLNYTFNDFQTFKKRLTFILSKVKLSTKELSITADKMCIGSLNMYELVVEKTFAGLTIYEITMETVRNYTDTTGK